jgi:sulfatase modifying factor 1
MKRFVVIPFILLFSSVMIFFFLTCAESKNEKNDTCSGLNVPSDMKCISGGKFIRGSNKISRDEDHWGRHGRLRVRDEYPREKIYISTFYMDTYEVTFSQYRKCMKAGACTKARPNYRGYSRPKQPMLGANWYQARAYCRWKGKRLPTEMEWEKSARGVNGNIYPWGNSRADCSKAIIKYRGKKGCGTGRTWNVGTRGPYQYGLYDMAGNAHEWVNDWYSKSYDKCGINCRKKDPRGPCNGADKCPGYKLKSVRGGSWWWSGIYARASNRRGHYPKNKPYHHYGFRCAKSVVRGK